MAFKGDVWAASSKDYDSLLFGAPRLVRYLTISGKEYLPSKGIARPLKPELIRLSNFLSFHGITREQLVDVAILMGTDFNEGIKGVGPKTAVNLLRKYGKIENMPDKIMSKIEDQAYEQVRTLFLQPPIVVDYNLNYDRMDENGLTDFLCNQRDFSRQRVETAIQRMQRFYARVKQTELEKWFIKGN